ncbi:hypothetical protein VNO80_06738 [Phaseolus coccineus]|uniref:Uncharacterized protein n=1 Tax=Phaseolus coccineus TaxID=3886 RepID=A0AAN9NHE0_PHACN
MLRKIGSSLKHQPSTQYPCTSPQSLHEMNLGLLGKNGEVHPNRPTKNKRRAKRQWRAKRMRNAHGEKSVWRISSRAHSLRFLGPKQCSLSWPKDLGRYAT